MRLRLESVAERLRASLFLLPMTSVVVAIVAGLLSVAADSRLDRDGAQLPLGFSSTVESARALLGTIASATITFAGIAFSVSLLVIQLASSQYSPRVVHTLFRDPFNKRVMGVVVGTFTYCVIVLRSVRSPLEDGGTPVIPNLSVAIAVTLGIVAILAVIAFINHNAHAMDVSEILDQVRHDAIEQIRREWAPLSETAALPQPRAQVAVEAGLVVRFDRSGWVQQIDVEAMVEEIPEGSTLLIETYAGRYAVEGTVLCRVSAPTAAGSEDVDSEALLAAVVTGDTRTMQQDVSYGLRQLVDVALRALSPGVNDPTTAQDAIFHATAVLAEMLRRTPPSPLRHHEGARTVALPEAPDHDGLIELTFDEIRRAAAPHPTVCIYVLEALRLLSESVSAVDPAVGAAAIARQARLVVAGCEDAEMIDDDLAAVRRAHEIRFGTQ